MSIICLLALGRDAVGIASSSVALFDGHKPTPRELKKIYDEVTANGTTRFDKNAWQRWVTYRGLTQQDIKNGRGRLYLAVDADMLAELASRLGDGIGRRINMGNEIRPLWVWVFGRKADDAKVILAERASQLPQINEILEYYKLPPTDSFVTIEAYASLSFRAMDKIKDGIVSFEEFTKYFSSF